MQHFAVQLNANQQTTHSFRASQYKKRKRGGRDEEQESSSTSPEPQDAVHSASSLLPDPVQLRTAGLLAEASIHVPPKPFPHAPVADDKDHLGAIQVQEELASPPTRLYAVGTTSKGEVVPSHETSDSLKKSHLNLLSTIMHQSILRGDYERAGRAWGMLLRTQVAGGNPVDPRNHGRWGVGAEILLHRNSESAPRDNSNSNVSHQAFGMDAFSEYGFELAREYYERLIVQYPNRKLVPHAIDERTFYPAMFSLWIFEVRANSRRARYRAQTEREPRSSSVGLDREDVSNHHAKEEAIQVEELSRAMEIAERMDQLIASPPFDKHAELLQLRGHVCLWIGTLVIENTSDDEDEDMTSDISVDEDGTSSEAQLTQLLTSQKELQQSQTFFQRAEANGAPRQPETIASVKLKLREITRKITKLRGHSGNAYS